jgi:hypothetical protein
MPSTARRAAGAALPFIAAFGAAVLTVAGAVAPAEAAPAGPVPVLQLFEAVPELPASAEAAATWVDKRGTLLHPGLLQLREAMAAHRQHVARIEQAVALQGHQQGQVMVESLQQGMADVGIDMQRLQSDPAYAQQVQDRIRRMTPAEQMALAQRMNQPLNQDRRFVNQAQALAEDAPHFRAAAEAGEAYAQAQPERFARQRALWAEAEAAVERVRTKKLEPGLPKPRMEWDNPGCDRACQGAWDAYAARLLPLLIARDSEILQIRRTALQRHRAQLAADIKAADRHLLATSYGAGSRSSVNQQRIVGYDAAAIAEIQTLIERTAEAARNAAVTVHCGKQAVLVPMAVCS